MEINNKLSDKRSKEFITGIDAQLLYTMFQNQFLEGQIKLCVRVGQYQSEDLEKLKIKVFNLQK